MVSEAEYPEGDTWNRILRDTIISGLFSNKICAKAIKEGKDVILPKVMEIARLEVSTLRHLDQMWEMTKVNYVQYGRNSKPKGKSKHSGKTSGSSGNSRSAGKPSSSGGKGRKVPLPSDIFGDVVKEDIRRVNLAKLWKLHVGTVPSRGTMRKFA